jgi:hypothetical protein
MPRHANQTIGHEVKSSDSTTSKTWRLDEQMRRRCIEVMGPYAPRWMTGKKTLLEVRY